jgi:nitrite reductase/ring-hydroxylating ferredoxin subunit
LLLHVDDVIPGMQLESAIALKAGSYLITPKEAPDGLNDKFILSIQRFSSQFTPLPNFVNIVENNSMFVRLGEVLSADITRVAEAVKADGDTPNFLSDGELEGKVTRVVDKVMANPDVIREVYQFKNAFREGASSKVALLDHTFRVTLLAAATGVKLRMSVISLINLVTASLMHDMGVLRTELYPALEELDELHDDKVQDFVDEHTRLSVEIFEKARMSMLPQTRSDIVRTIELHHRLDLATEKPRSRAVVLHLADLVDEVIGPQPHKLRYNFSRENLRVLGTRMAQRNGINRVMLALIKLYRKVPAAWDTVVALCDLFGLQELTIANYEEKLKGILDICPHAMQKPYPSLSGGKVPRMVYCFDLKQSFSCEHRGQSKVAIQTPTGKMVQYYKCGTMTNSLVALNQQSKPNES